MDYRYETKDEARDFHKQRRAFIILNDELEILPLGSNMSHFEYCESKGIDKETFNKITRGYYLNGRLVFYKDNFIYDDALIVESIRHLEEIVEALQINDFNIYFGVIPEDNFAPDFFFGKYEDGSLIKPLIKGLNKKD